MSDYVNKLNQIVGVEEQKVRLLKRQKAMIELQLKEENEKLKQSKSQLKAYTGLLKKADIISETVVQDQLHVEYESKS